MSDEEAVPTIIDPAATFGDTITVRTAQVLAYQQGTEKRIRRQVENQNRLLAQIEELQGINVRDADEIARLSRALVEEQEMYAAQKVLLDRAREERDELLSTFGGMIDWLKNRGLEHTKEGTVYTREAYPGEVESTWERHADTATIDPEQEVREALPTTLPTDEERPGKHLAG